MAGYFNSTSVDGFEFALSSSSEALIFLWYAQLKHLHKTSRLIDYIILSFVFVSHIHTSGYDINMVDKRNNNNDKSFLFSTTFVLTSLLITFSPQIVVYIYLYWIGPNYYLYFLFSTTKKNWITNKN